MVIAESCIYVKGIFVRRRGGGVVSIEIVLMAGVQRNVLVQLIILLAKCQAYW